jgi:uncharacterized protein YbaR (Trm112 family)
MTVSTDAPSNDNREAERLGLSPDLLAILVCPVDHNSLAIEGNDLVCASCGRHYPVADGIPNLVVE